VAPSGYHAPVQKLLALAPVALLLAACGGHAPVRPASGQAAPATAAAPAAPATPTPPRTDVLLARARALRADGDVPAARSRLEAAYQVDPAAPAVRVELADVLVAEGMELDRAAALLDGLADTPDGRVSLVRARLCEARGDDAGAAAAYAVALAAADDPEARLRRALALERLGRTGEQIVELERIRVARPGDAFARAHLGDAYEEAGRRPEAEAELRWVAESQPERPAGWLRLARFYERAGRTREAHEAAEKARVASGSRQERNLRPLLRSRN
jgi:predicted Zn-dependent protease